MIRQAQVSDKALEERAAEYRALAGRAKDVERRSACLERAAVCEELADRRAEMGEMDVRLTAAIGRLENIIQLREEERRRG